MSGDDKILRIEIPRVERKVPRLGETVFRAPRGDDELRLAGYYSAAEPDHRSFVNEAVAAAIESPSVDPVRIDGLSERARATCRVAVAQVSGCENEFRRLRGGGMSGDERLYQAMRRHHELQLEKLRLLGEAMTGNVVRLAERTRKMVIGSGAIDYLARNQRSIERLSEMYTRSIRPDYFTQIERTNRRLTRMFTPPVIEQLTKTTTALTSFANSYAGMADKLTRQFDSVLPPNYFGALVKLNDQIGQSVRPRYLDQISRLAQEMQDVIRPQYLGQLTRTMARLQEIAMPRYVESLSRLAEQMSGPAIGRLREQFFAGAERYAAWIELNWARIYADADNPPPIMFLLAALPMAVGLPLLRALKATDELLLERLEEALSDRTLVDRLQEAVQQSPELDDVATRYLVQALTATHEQRYVDAAPPLALGLERAFKCAARGRGIIDSNNRFLVSTKSNRNRAKKVEDLFEPLGLDKLYARFLNAWVFGDYGNSARHGDLPEPEHRRWVLRATLALVGWFDYCANVESPMEALVQRLQLPPASQTKADEAQSA
jgi:hypothetical protein